MSKKETKDRITREKEMLPEMVKIYCHGVHNRLDHCRWGNEKNFCSQCPCHCYKPAMREKIRAVMRYSGPRIMLYHPLVGSLHAFETVKGVIKAKKSH